MRALLGEAPKRKARTAWVGQGLHQGRSGGRRHPGIQRKSGESAPAGHNNIILIPAGVSLAGLSLHLIILFFAKLQNNPDNSVAGRCLDLSAVPVRGLWSGTKHLIRSIAPLGDGWAGGDVLVRAGLAPWLLHARLALGLAVIATRPVPGGLAKSRARTATLSVFFFVFSSCPCAKPHHSEDPGGAGQASRVFVTRA